MSTASVRSLVRADSLARQIAALDVVLEQRRALEAEVPRLDIEVGSLRDRLFEIRLDRSGAERFVEEVESMRERISARATELEKANEWFSNEKLGVRSS